MGDVRETVREIAIDERASPKPRAIGVRLRLPQSVVYLTMLGSGSPAAPSPNSERRRLVLDLVLAGIICAAAVLYWTWDTTRDSSPQDTSDSSSTQTPAERQYNAEGYRLFQAADYVGAEGQFRKSIAANPESAVAYTNLGAALISQQRYDKAIAALQKAISLDPAYALARNNLSWAYEEKEKSGN